MSAIRLHQRVAFYYDVTQLSHKDGEAISDKLRQIYGLYYNMVFFSDYVPGFLSNLESTTLFEQKPNFTFVVFLNYDARSPHQSSLLNEFIKRKYEYIIFSPYEMDLVAYVPFIYINANLNDLLLLKLVNFYLMEYIAMFVNYKRHNLKGDVYIQTIFNLNCLYCLLLIQDTNLLELHLKEFVFSLKDLKRENLLSILTRPTLRKTKFFIMYETPERIQIIKKQQKVIRRLFLKKFNRLISTLKKKDSFIYKHITLIKQIKKKKND
jgi:hypothetical protein